MQFVHPKVAQPKTRPFALESALDGQYPVRHEWQTARGVKANSKLVQSALSPEHGGYLT